MKYFDINLNVGSVAGENNLLLCPVMAASSKKHCKNCECCPGHYLVVNHYSSMPWFKFRNLLVIVNCVTNSLNRSQCLCLCLCSPCSYWVVVVIDKSPSSDHTYCLCHTCNLKKPPSLCLGTFPPQQHQGSPPLPGLGLGPLKHLLQSLYKRQIHVNFACTIGISNKRRKKKLEVK